MPVNNLFVVKEKYGVLNNSTVKDLRTPYAKFPTANATYSGEELLHEMSVKKIIAALEDIVKVLEKKIQNLKKIKEQKGKNVR